MALTWSKVKFSDKHMTTQFKLQVSICALFIVSMLDLFSKPLHVPETVKWVLPLAIFILLGIILYWAKAQKQERQQQIVTDDDFARWLRESQQRTKRGLITLMVLGVAVGLCAPLWLPLTGASLGSLGNLGCGIVTAIVICVICSIRLSRL